MLTIPDETTVKTITNPVTGATIDFKRRADDKPGEVARFDYYVKPHMAVEAPHVHLRQRERFHVVFGRMGVLVGHEKRVLTTGQSVEIPPNTASYFWNEGDRDLHVRIEMRPALEIQHFLETLFEFSHREEVTQNGTPKTLNAAWQLSQWTRRCELYHARFPVSLQRAGIAVLTKSLSVVGYDRPMVAPLPDPAVPSARAA